jgi:hypothetical protein
MQMGDLSPKQQSDVFIDEVLHRFSFLPRKCGYHSPKIRQRVEGMSSDYTAIRYESESIFFEVFYAHMEAELSLGIGMLQPDHACEGYRLSFRLGEALSLSGKDAALPTRFAHPRSESELQGAIDALASAVQQHLRDVLCDPGILSEWAQSRKLRDEKKRAEDMITLKFKEAEGAWMARDYETVVSIYGSFCDRLTGLECKRLSYAKKQTGGIDGK